LPRVPCTDFSDLRKWMERRGGRVKTSLVNSHGHGNVKQRRRSGTREGEERREGLSGTADTRRIVNRLGNKQWCQRS
jgi:hypothetical protein